MWTVDRQSGIAFGVASSAAIFIAIMLVTSAQHHAVVAAYQRAAYETEMTNPVPVIICRDGVIQVVNPAAEEALGISAKQTVGRDAVELIPERFRARHVAAMARLSRRAIGESGSSKYLLPTVSPKGVHNRWWVTVSWRRSEDGSLLSVARFVNYVLDSESAWLDVETMKMVKASISMDSAFAPKTMHANYGG